MRRVKYRISGFRSRNTFGFQIGRLNVFLWAGSWSWARKDRQVECGHCWNYYIGPFGIEWAHVEGWDD